MINDHLQLSRDLLTQMRISDHEYLTSEQPISKIDHFSADSSLISFTSLPLIKRYLNSICAMWMCYCK